VENLIAYGGAIKAVEGADGTVTLSGISVVFDEPGTRNRDLTGEYFTSDTYYGTWAKEGAFRTDSIFHHGIPLDTSAKAQRLADAVLADATMTKTGEGWLTSLVLPMREDYEHEIADLAARGKLGWSTGSAPHVVRKDADGKITRWPIVEVSITPRPAEPRTTLFPVKSLVWHRSALERELEAIKRTADEVVVTASLADLNRYLSQLKRA